MHRTHHERHIYNSLDGSHEPNTRRSSATNTKVGTHFKPVSPSFHGTKTISPMPSWLVEETHLMADSTESTQTSMRREGTVTSTSMQSSNEASFAGERQLRDPLTWPSIQKGKANISFQARVTTNPVAAV